MNLEYFEKREKLLNDKLSNLQKKFDESKDLEELRSLASNMDEIKADLNEVRGMISEIKEEEARSASQTSTSTNVNPLMAYGVRNNTSDEDMEYRTAFMNYVQRGVAIPENLARRSAGDAGSTVTADIGALIPSTVMNEVIKDLEGEYGSLYAKVRKLNVQGGVRFPVASLGAKFTWINEGTSGDKTKIGDATQYVSFSYYIGEVKLAHSLLSAIVSLPVFESEIARLIAKSYVEAMEKAIIGGTGEGQALGIINDNRVTNVATFTEAKIGDWKAWHTDFFSKMPLSVRSKKGEFFFTASTVETYLETMSDKNDNPLFKVATDGNIGALAGKFFGRNVTLVENNLGIKDFATASAGDVIGIYFDPNDYAINTNMEFTLSRYFDNDTNEIIDKALVVVDGKMLDTTGCYLIKKA